MKTKPVKTSKDLAYAKDKMAPVKQVVSATSTAGKLRDRKKVVNKKSGYWHAVHDQREARLQEGACLGA